VLEFSVLQILELFLLLMASSFRFLSSINIFTVFVDGRSGGALSSTSMSESALEELSPFLKGVMTNGGVRSFLKTCSSYDTEKEQTTKLVERVRK
jgi:hypothetical protein